MKAVFVVLCLVTLVACEPPRYRFQRVEAAPYPPAGTRPTGQEFRLPERKPEKVQQAKKAPQVKSEKVLQEGVYYIYHPDGLLQKVSYVTKGDVKDMGVTAQLRYQDVEPINAPVYTYDPHTLVLEQIVL